MALALHADELGSLLALARAGEPDLVRDLQRLVDIDSGTFTPAGADRVSGWIARRLEALGATVSSHAHPEVGVTRVATLEGATAGPTILLVGHADTVFEAGTAGARPFRIADGRAFGPGVADMKSGLLIGLYALSILRERARGADDWLPAGRIVFVVNADEEIGSPASTPVIEALSAGADVALVLEGARPAGEIVTARAGMLHLRISITGRAAHAGVEPEKGRSAVLEAAHLIVALSTMARGRPGTSINVGEADGGTRPNIVAAEATLTLDIRSPSSAEQDAVEADIRALVAAPTVPDTSASVEVLARSRPLERTAASAALLEVGVEVARGLGFVLAETSSGGASDGNTTAGAGVPTLDGLGAIGGDRHADGEYVELDSIAPRTAWLAALMTEIGQRATPTRRE